LLKNASSYISSASAYIPAIDKEIDSVNYNKLPMDEFKALLAVRNRLESPFIYWQNRLFISMPNPSNIQSPSYIISVEISQEALKSDLKQFVIDGSGGAVILGDKEDWTVANNENPTVISHFKQWVQQKEMQGMKSGNQSNKINNVNYILSFEHSDILGISLLMYVPENEVTGALKQYRLWFWLLSAVSFVLISVFFFWIYRLIYRPIINLVRAFRIVEKGNLTVVVEHRSKDEFRYLYRQFNSMVLKLKALIEEVYEHKYRVKISELRQLQSQINPHFLYNSFFNLYGVARMRDIDKVIEITKHLGEYFQFISRSMDNVSLEMEVKYARAYVEIQTIRFEEQIAVEFSPLPDHYKEVIIPKLILQPIIENCYNHGLEEQYSAGKIRIHMVEHLESLSIYVEDNGERMTLEMLAQLQRNLDQVTENLEATSGMMNVHRRLQLKYGIYGGLLLSLSEWGGLCVEIRIPIMEE
jgi:two-component system sensor histidine kinase YesM